MNQAGLEHLENIPSWNEYFFKMIPLIKSRSKDKHTQVGCVIVNRFNNIISTGYNSLPAGVNDHDPERYERPLKYEYMVHSEENAICAAAKAGIALAGSTIYMDGTPCITCARMIIQSGISHIIYNEATHALWNSPKYDKTMEQKVRQLLYEAQVTVEGVTI